MAKRLDLRLPDVLYTEIVKLANIQGNRINPKTGNIEVSSTVLGLIRKGLNMPDSVADTLPDRLSDSMPNIMPDNLSDMIEALIEKKLEEFGKSDTYQLLVEQVNNNQIFFLIRDLRL